MMCALRHGECQANQLGVLAFLSFDVAFRGRQVLVCRPGNRPCCAPLSLLAAQLLYYWKGELAPKPLATIKPGKTKSMSTVWRQSRADDRPTDLSRAHELLPGPLLFQQGHVYTMKGGGTKAHGTACSSNH